MLLKLYSVNELKIIDNDGRNIMHYAIQAECSDGLKVSSLIYILTRKQSIHIIIIQGILVPKLKKLSFSRVLSLNPYIYKKWLKLYIKTINVNFKLIIRREN